MDKYLTDLRFYRTDLHAHIDNKCIKNRLAVNDNLQHEYDVSFEMKI